MEVDVRAEQVEWPIERVEADARHVLQSLELGAVELSVLLCDDPFIHELNRQYRAKDAPTDVLSFPMREGEGADPDDPMLGDVVISVETAARQATERGHATGWEIRLLLIHGILHLLGYDHERGEAAAEDMDRQAARLLALLVDSES